MIYEIHIYWNKAALGAASIPDLRNWLKLEPNSRHPLCAMGNTYLKVCNGRRQAAIFHRHVHLFSIPQATTNRHECDMKEKHCRSAVVTFVRYFHSSLVSNAEEPPYGLGLDRRCSDHSWAPLGRRKGPAWDRSSGCAGGSILIYRRPLAS